MSVSQSHSPIFYKPYIHSGSNLLQETVNEHIIIDCLCQKHRKTLSMCVGSFLSACFHSPVLFFQSYYTLALRLLATGNIWLACHLEQHTHLGYRTAPMGAVFATFLFRQQECQWEAPSAAPSLTFTHAIGQKRARVPRRMPEGQKCSTLHA